MLPQIRGVVTAARVSFVVAVSGLIGLQRLKEVLVVFFIIAAVDDDELSDA
jgi:hypothetical protein